MLPFQRSPTFRVCGGFQVDIYPLGSLGAHEVVQLCLMVQFPLQLPHLLTMLHKIVLRLVTQRLQLRESFLPAEANLIISVQQKGSIYSRPVYRLS